MIVRGKVTVVHGLPNPHSYTIKDSEGNEYHLHLGDLEKNEHILYLLNDRLSNNNDITELVKSSLLKVETFDKGDEGEFEPWVEGKGKGHNAKKVE